MRLFKPEVEKTADSKPAVINNTFPFHTLDHRRFEMLLYTLFSQEIQLGDLQGVYDDIWLMEGVREKGKDCSLFLKGTLKGVIQCKHRSTLDRVGKSEVAKEIIKFVLHLLNQEEPLLPPQVYYFVVSSDFDTGARELLENFGEQILKEKDLEKWLRTVIDGNKALQKLSYATIKEPLLSLLVSLQVKHYASHDLTTLLQKPYNQHVIETFFTVKTVIEERKVLEAVDKIQTQLATIKTTSLQEELSPEEAQEQLQQASFLLATYDNQFFNLPASHLKRKETEQLYHWINTPLSTEKKEESILLLVGNAGYGKSVILRDLCERLQEEKIPVLGIKADRFAVSSMQELQQRLNLQVDLIKSLQTLSSRFETVVVLVDQIDALSQTLSSQREALQTFQSLINSIKDIPHVRIIVSVRSFDLHYDPDLRYYKKQKTIPVSLLSKEDVLQVLAQLPFAKQNYSSALLSLLQTPNHLNVFCRIYHPSLALEPIKSLQDLYHEFWKQIFSSIPAKSPFQASSVKSLLNKLAAQMHANQHISVPETPFIDQYLKEIEYLCSQGILSYAKNELQFFHQTFYDYVFARQFVESKQSVTDYIKANENSLFIRSSVKMIISFLSQHDHPQYIYTLREIIASKAYLFHIKLLVYNLLGFVEAPSPQELALIRRDILPQYHRKILFMESVNSERLLEFLIQEKAVDNLLQPQKSLWDYALESKPGQKLEILKKKRIRFPNHANSKRKEEGYNLCYSLLARHLPVSRETIVKYLSNCLEFENKGAFIFRILYFIKEWDFEEAFELFEKYKEKGYSDTFQFFNILQDAALYNPEWVINIYQPFLLANAKGGDGSLKKHGHDSYQENELFKKLFKQAPQKAFSFGWTVLNAFITQTEAPYNSNPALLNDKTFFMYDYERGESDHGTYSQLYFLMIETLTNWIHQNSNEYTLIYERIKASNKITFLKMLLYAWINLEKNPPHYANDFFNFLDEVNQKQALVTDEKFEYLIRQALKKFFPLFNEAQKQAFFTMILTLKDPFELHKHNLRGKPDFWRNFGLTKYKYLGVLPKEEIYKNGEVRKLFLELERRYPQLEDKEPLKVRVYGVGAPLTKSAYEKMNFEQWLNSFQKYDSDDRSFRTNPEKGGLIENYRAFKAEVEKRPQYFLPFVEALMEQAVHPSYLIAGLDGLKSAKIDADEFFKLYKRAIRKHYDQSDTMQLVWMADYLIQQKKVDDEILDFLIHLALTHPDPQEDKGHPKHEALNTVRGAAVEKLTIIDFNPHFAEKIFATLEKVADDPQVSVRVSLVSRLACLMNLDKVKTFSIFLKVTQSFQLDVYAASIWSGQYLANYKFEKLKNYFTNFITHPDTSEEIATVLAVAFLNGKKGSARLLNQLFRKSIKARRKIIHVGFVNLLDKDQNIEKKAASLYLKGLNFWDNEVLQEYSFSFLKADPAHFEILYPLIYKFSRSKAGYKELHYYYEYLLKCVKIYPEKCLTLISNIHKHEKVEPSRRMTQEEPVKLAISIYNALQKIEGKKKKAQKALLIFDTLLQDPLYRHNAKKVTDEVEY